MAQYTICPECGAALDPGEKCDCRLRVTKEMVGELLASDLKDEFAAAMDMLKNVEYSFEDCEEVINRFYERLYQQRKGGAA